MKIDPTRTVSFTGHRTFKANPPADLFSSGADKMSVSVGITAGIRDSGPGAESSAILPGAGPVVGNGGGASSNCCHDPFGNGKIFGRLCTVIESLYRQGYDTFLCGMAEGFDLLAGQAVLKVKEKFPAIEIIAVIPYPKTLTPIHKDYEAYTAILTAAQHRIVIAEAYAPDCFHRRNDFLVNNSSVTVCYYTGAPGGTNYTVQRALARGNKVENLWTDSNK